MSDTSGPDSYQPRDKRWRVEYEFRGQGPLGRLPGLGGVNGYAAHDTFERVAAHVIATAARHRHPGDPAPSDLGQVLLTHARRVAHDIGHWHYEPDPGTDPDPGWATVTITHHPRRPAVTVSPHQTRYPTAAADGHDDAPANRHDTPNTNIEDTARAALGIPPRAPHTTTDD
ncbi:hypothetical protein [Kitasatospora sp. NPDC058046]|uniref:hypothetical protein n=1 Tax=Kitasatospora sp. NPDC058046 TaxID=3346312 RepID=UPI0036DC094F